MSAGIRPHLTGGRPILTGGQHLWIADTSAAGAMSIDGCAIDGCVEVRQAADTPAAGPCQLMAVLMSQLAPCQLMDVLMYEGRRIHPQLAPSNDGCVDVLRSADTSAAGTMSMKAHSTYLQSTTGLVVHGEEHGYPIASWLDPEMGLEVSAQS